MNLNLPPEPKPGQPIRAAHYSALVRAVRALFPRSGPGIMVSMMPNGTTISAITRTGGGGGGDAGGRFLMPVKVGDKWSVTPGHINNQVPTCNGAAMNGSKPADWAAPISGEGGIYAVCQFSMGQGDSQPVFTVEIVFSAGTPASTAYRGHYLIGRIFNISKDSKPSYEVVPYNASSLQASVNGGTWMWYGPSTEWIPQAAKQEESA